MIRSFYYRLSFRMKLLILISGLCMTIIAVFGYLVYRIATNEVILNSKTNIHSLIEQTIVHLDFVAQDVSDASNFLILSQDLHKSLKMSSSNQWEASYLEQTNQTRESINQLIISRHYIKSILIYSDRLNPLTFSNYSMNPVMSYDEFKDTAYYRIASSSPGTMFWGTYSNVNRIFPDAINGELLMMGMLMNGFTGKSDGFIVFGLDAKDLIPQSSGSGARTYVINDQGDILSDSTGQSTGRLVGELPYFGGQTIADLNQSGWSGIENDWIVSHSQSRISGWHLLIAQPRSELISKLGHIKTITLLSMLVALVLSVVISWYISNYVAKPIIRILSSIRKFQRGDFEQSVKTEGKDELAQLGKGYNTMVKSIKDLVNDQYRSRLKLKESELSLLQSQINPHFLYNTLSTMSYMSHQEGSHKIAEMLYSLAKIFRISLSDGQEFIPIEKETELIQSYLSLQQNRFPDKFTFEIHVEQTARTALIPKLTLQPFVENALIHGIQPSVDHGFIRIHVELIDQILHIEITDNGVGMAAAYIKSMGIGTAGIDTIDVEIFDQAERPRSGYAIRNVRQRLHLYYGDEATLNITSKPDYGTSIAISLPLTSGVDRNHV